MIDSAVRCNPLENAYPQVSSVQSMEIRPDAYVWRQVADELIRRIRDGRYPPGMPIPAERRLADELGVSVGSVRRATAELVEARWLRILPRKGVFVTPAEDWPADE